MSQAYLDRILRAGLSDRKGTADQRASINQELNESQDDEALERMMNQATAGGPAVGQQLQQTPEGLLGPGQEAAVADKSINPNVGTHTFAENEISPLEKWKGQIDAMMNSGNPDLQEDAQKMMESYYQKATTATPGSSPAAAVKEYQFAQTPAGGSFKGTLQEWKNVNKTKMFDDSVSASDAAKMVDKNGKPVKVPVGMTYAGAKAEGWSYGTRQTEGEAQQSASFDVAISMAEELTELTTLHGADLSGLAGAVEDYRSGSDAGGVAVNLALESMGLPINRQNIRAHTLSRKMNSIVLQAMRGAAVGPEEEKLFNRQLPVAGQPKEVFEENLRLTLEHLRELKDRKQSARGTNDPMAATDPALPPGFTWDD